MKNFTPVPNEWFDHLADGRLTPPMFDILCYLTRTCTWSVGLWKGEAERIRYGLNRTWSISQINRYLTRLHNCRYLTRLNTPGRRGGYKILLNNYASVDAKHEKLLRPTILRDWQDFDCEDASLAASEVRVRCVGDASDDACEMRSNPDVLNVTPDEPDALDVQTNECMNTRAPSSGGFEVEDGEYGTLVDYKQPVKAEAAGKGFDVEEAE